MIVLFRLEHGNVKHKISWSTPIDQVVFDPVLVSLAEGLQETKHPYNFVARTGFHELLNSENAKEKATPLVGRLIQPFKHALVIVYCMDCKVIYYLHVAFL